ncbi:radical SAM protein [Candidatus Bathyarchaeota archaeon]|nr:radical SAM protein [Candidatus Bathyarchaeota archaeon]
MLYDPLKLAEKIEEIVVNGVARKYYRVARAGKWYGGIATADCCGCCLKCIFCWSGAPRDNPDKIGKFYSPEKVFDKLRKCAEKFGYKLLRISGNEPTIGKNHLLKILELIDQTRYKFILESNGILIDSNYAKQLSKFKCVHARISIKGTKPEEFSNLTNALPEFFNLQLNSLKNLLDAGVSCHPAVMLSFSSKKSFEKLKEHLKEVDEKLPLEIEEEYVFLYPHVIKRLSEAGIKPLIAYKPNSIPKELI